MHLSVILLAPMLALLGSSTAAGRAKEPTRKAGDIVIERSSLAVPRIGKVECEIGTLYVPENRAVRDSRLIGVGFARFKAQGKTGAPPVFRLPGGPGSSYLSDLKPGNPRRAGRIRDILQFRSVGDVVVVDQRGYSERGDVLKYSYRTPEESLDLPASEKRYKAAFAEMARSAVKQFDKREIDLRGYNVKECADDVDDLRRALGYERITLVGGSFGSQWSFAVMRRHPERVARALLGGVEPLDCAYDMPSHVMAAMQRMWWEAERDERFQPYLPPGGIMAAAREVVRRLEREPIRVPLKGVTDSRTGKPVTIALGPADFHRAPPLRSTAGPAFVLSLYHRQYGQWAFVSAMRRRSRRTDYRLISALYDTSLGVTPQRRHLLYNDPATRFLGTWNFAAYDATANIWPSPDVGDDFRTEVVCRIPVVFVQGDWDTQTPVENLLQIAPYFRKGHVLLVERGGHGAMGQVARHLPKTMDSLIEFLKTGGTASLPVRVTVPAPRFDLPSFPPPAK